MFPSTKTALPNSSHKKGKTEKRKPSQRAKLFGYLKREKQLHLHTREEGQC
jgi:hypothetical protein